MSMWDTVSIPIGIKQSIDNIFASVLVGGIDTADGKNSEIYTNKMATRKYTAAKFVGTFQSNIFNNAYAVFYDIVIKLGTGIFSVEQIETIIDNNRDIVLDTPFINKADFVGGDRNIPNDDDIINAMIVVLKGEYVRLSYKSVSAEEFDSACKIYIDWYKDNYMFYVCNNMTIIMSNTGLDVRTSSRRSRHYQGRKDAEEYYAENMAILNSIGSSGGLKVVPLDEKWYREKAEKSKEEDDKALMTIGLQEIDSVWKMLRRGNMVGILGRSKGGKTRFSTYMAARAVRMGLNVFIMIMEGTEEEWSSAITASIIADVSYQAVKKGQANKITRISSKDILENTFRNKKNINALINATRADIAMSPKYGHVEIMTGTQYKETLQDVIKAQYKKSPFDIIIIDSLVNISSKSGKSKSEAISEAYMETKQTIEYGLPVPALAFVTAQMKQVVIDELRKNPDAEIPITAGGESAETIRTPDYTLGMFSTDEELDADIMKLFSVAQRHTRRFENFSCRGYMDCCYFLSEADDLGK